MSKLDGKAAVIIGGGRGLGRNVAEALSRAGVRVVVAARSQSEIEQVAAGLRSDGGQALAVVTDATCEEDVQRLAATARTAYGAIDIVVNCAGESLIKNTFSTTYADYHRIMNANLATTYLTAREFLPAMQERGQGLLVNLSSRAALDGVPDISLYRAAKAGVIAFTQSLSQEARKHGVRVVVLSPGPMDTPMRWEATPQMDPATVIAPQVLSHLILMLAGNPELTFDETLVPVSVRYYAPDALRKS